MQLETPTPVKATKQQQSQSMVTDLCGRLYGEVEDILHTLGVKIDAKYSKYTYVHNAGVPNNLLNLETTLLGISVICSEKKKD